jgi:hypothetical protein
MMFEAGSLRRGSLRWELGWAEGEAKAAALAAPLDDAETKRAGGRRP